jgi:hypothetical protein
MRLNAEGWLWILFGSYFLAVGLGRLPLPRRVRDWFDEVDRERYRVGLRALAPILIVAGVALLLGLL